MDTDKPIVLKATSDTTFVTTASNPRSLESSSLFGERSCGEPLATQHLVIDFTPQDDTDNEYVQKKCCAFWKFVASQPLLQNFRALPDTNAYRKNLDSSAVTSDGNETFQSIPLERTAVSMLEIVQGKGLIDRTFEAQVVQSSCSLGSREYHENGTTAMAEKPLTKEGCVCTGSCTTCSLPLSVTPSTPGVVDLCKKMQDWDDKHPKSMEPPGHPPALSHCIMQRKMVS